MLYKVTYQEDGKIKQKNLDVKTFDEKDYPKNIIKIEKRYKLSTFFDYSNKKKDILNLLKQLSVMLNSNLSFGEGIEILLKMKSNSFTKEVLAQILKGIKNSKPIDEVLKNFKIEPIVILFLKLGLENGNIKESLNFLVLILEQNQKNKEKFADTLRYPIILISSLVVALVMIFLYVIPNFEFIFSSFENKIPLSTKILFTLDSIFKNYFYWIILFIFMLGFFTYFFYNRNRIFFDKFLILNIPILSKLLKAYYFHRFFLLIWVIVKSKYRFQIAILNAKDIVSNLYVKKVILDILNKIKNGTSISKAFEETKLFDHLTIRLLYTAEKTNNYEDILKDISNYYDQRFQHFLKLFSSLVEPVIVFIISLIVLWLITAVMFPVWNITAILN